MFIQRGVSCLLHSFQVGIDASCMPVLFYIYVGEELPVIPLCSFM